MTKTTETTETTEINKTCLAIRISFAILTVYGLANGDILTFTLGSIITLMGCSL